jgi:hypothetical protein
MPTPQLVRGGGPRHARGWGMESRRGGTRPREPRVQARGSRRRAHGSRARGPAPLAQPSHLVCLAFVVAPFCFKPARLRIRKQQARGLCWQQHQDQPPFDAVGQSTYPSYACVGKHALTKSAPGLNKKNSRPPPAGSPNRIKAGGGQRRAPNVRYCVSQNLGNFDWRICPVRLESLSA